MRLFKWWMNFLSYSFNLCIVFFYYVNAFLNLHREAKPLHIFHHSFIFPIALPLIIGCLFFIPISHLMQLSCFLYNEQVNLKRKLWKKNELRSSVTGNLEPSWIKIPKSYGDLNTTHNIHFSALKLKYTSQKGSLYWMPNMLVSCCILLLSTPSFEVIEVFSPLLLLRVCENFHQNRATI